MTEESEDEEPLSRRKPLNPAPALDNALINRHVTRGIPSWPPKVDRSLAHSTLLIDGVEVLFPEKSPFHTQIHMMKHMIAAFKKSNHALLESPTGTGKSLALLCAAVAFQIHQYKNGATVPFVIIASRTHSQLKSLARELRRSPYRPLTTTMGSRSRFCQHPSRNKRQLPVDEFCVNALAEHNCSFAEAVSKDAHVDPISQLCKGNRDNLVFDIEEMVDFCGDACSYYTSRELASRSHVIFVPYNYVIDPAISARLDMLSGSIVIIDEAHNILDIAMDAASATLEKDHLPETVRACDQLAKHHTALLDYIEKKESLGEYLDPKKKECIKAILSITPVRILASKLNALLSQLQNSAERVENESRYPRNESEYVFWASSPPASSAAIRSALTTLGLTENICRHIQQVRRSWSDAADLLKDRFRTFLRMMDSTLGMTAACCRAWRDASAFRLLFVRTWNPSKICWKSSLRLLCLSAEVIINQQCDGLRSFLVSSGTLSPVPEFCRDLGEAFNARLLSKLQNGHVVDPTKQLLFGTLGVGCSSEVLCGTMKEQNSSYYRGVGHVVERVCASVPFGVLVFVSSYGALQKFTSEWKKSGSWHNIMKYKGVPFIEPSQSSDEEFQTICNGFRAAAVKDMGAIMLGVYRAKASEGISFSNDVCRACICVSLPLPNYADIRIRAKIEHNDRVAGDGHHWYEQQAYRAVNQALGRVIRHAGDYGVLLLLDKRFASKSNRDVSAWLRAHMQHFVSVDQMCEKTKDFFAAVERLKPFKYVNTDPTASCHSDLPEEENGNPDPISSTDKKGRTESEPERPMDLTQNSQGLNEEPMMLSESVNQYRIAYKQLMFDE